MINISYRIVHLVLNKFFSTQKFGFIFYDCLYPVKDLCTCAMKISVAPFPFGRQANQKLENDI